MDSFSWLFCSKFNIFSTLFSSSSSFWILLLISCSLFIFISSFSSLIFKILLLFFLLDESLLLILFFRFWLFLNDKSLCLTPIFNSELLFLLSIFFPVLLPPPNSSPWMNPLTSSKFSISILFNLCFFSSTFLKVIFCLFFSIILAFSFAFFILFSFFIFSACGSLSLKLSE